MYTVKSILETEQLTNLFIPGKRLHAVCSLCNLQMKSELLTRFDQSSVCASREAGRKVNYCWGHIDPGMLLCISLNVVKMS